MKGQLYQWNKSECVVKLTAELDSLKMDRDRLIQDLKDQAMAVDTLRLELDSVSVEVDQRVAEQLYSYHLSIIWTLEEDVALNSPVTVCAEAC